MSFALWNSSTLSDAFHLKTCFPVPKFHLDFPSDGIMLKRHEIGLARSVLPKVKATAHHCATHASHISTRCENDFTPEIPF